MSRIAPLAVLAPLLLAVACGTTEPSPGTGVYALASVDGHPAPALRLATIDCDVSLTDATLHLRAASRADLDIAETIDCSRGGGAVTSTPRHYPGTYRIANGRFEIAVDEPPPSTGILIHGRTHGQSIIVDDPATHAAGRGALTFKPLTQ